MEHQRKDLLRAIQEGVAMNLNIILNIFKAENIHISELVAVEGGLKVNHGKKYLLMFIILKLSCQNH